MRDTTVTKDSIKTAKAFEAKYTMEDLQKAYLDGFY